MPFSGDSPIDCTAIYAFVYVYRVRSCCQPKQVVGGFYKVAVETVVILALSHVAQDLGDADEEEHSESILGGVG